MRTEDGGIIQECLNGKPGAFGILVDKYKAGIYAFVYTELRNFHDAQDVTQEVFLQAYCGLRSLRRWESFAFWLYRIAHNLCKKWLRAASRRPDRESIDDQDTVTLSDYSMNSYREDQVNRSLQEALDSLPQAYREVLLLHYFGGMTSKEIAGALGVSPAAILQRLTRARSALKEEMVDTIGRSFKRRRLPVTFTFRIVEAVKRLRIKPMPRMTGLPWGLSLATGITIALLSLSSHLSVFSPMDIPMDSTLPSETQASDTGEIPVDILSTSQITAPFSGLGNSYGEEPGFSDPLDATLLAPRAEQLMFPEEPAARLGKGTIERIAYSPDGRFIAAAGGIGVWLYNADDLTEVSLLEGHTALVESVSFSPDGKLLASAGKDNTVRLLDVERREEAGILRGHTGHALSVSFSPDGKLLASGSKDLTIRLWDVGERKEVAVLKGHTGYVLSISFSPNGKLLASGGTFSEALGEYDKGVRLWDVEERKQVAALEGHAHGIRSLSFSPDGKLLASASVDKTIRLWDVESKKEVAMLEHTGYVHSVSFSPDGSLLASGSEDKKLLLWDMAAREKVATLEHTDRVYSVAFGPDGDLLASASEDGILRLWDTDEKKETAVLKEHTSMVTSVSFSPDGELFAAGNINGMVQLWDVVAWEEVAMLEHTSSVQCVSFSPDGKLFAAGNYGDNTIKLWALPGKHEIAVLRGHTVWVSCVAFSPDSKLLASASGDRTVRLWDVAGREEDAVLRGHSGYVYSLAFSPDGELLASSGYDKTIRLWDVARERQIATLRGHTRYVSSVSFSPDGKLLASSGSYDKTIRIWDVARKTEIATLSGHTDSAYRVAFSPDGKWLASGGWDSTIRIWDVESGGEVAVVKGNAGEIYSIAFSPDGKWLASGGEDGTALFWEVDLGIPGRPVEPARKQLVTWGRLRRSELYQNYPNPFNAETWLPFQLAEAADVTIHIYNQSGRLARTLRLGRKEAGKHLEKSRAGYWDGRNDAGEPVASGVYFYRLDAGDFSQTRKMTMSQ